MAFQLPPLPNFNVQTPDLTQKALEGAQLKNMMSGMALRKTLAPLQVQEEQQKVQASTQENMLRQMSLDSNKKMMEFIASGGLSKFVGSDSNAPEGSGFDAIGASQELFKQGIIPEVANPIITHFQNIDKATSEITKNYGAAASDFLKNRATAHAQLADTLDEALRSENPAAGIPLVLAKFLKNPQGLSQEEIGGLKQLQGLRGDALVKATQLASATLNLGAEMDKHHAELAESAAKATKADIEAKEAAAEATGQITPKMATAQKQKIQLTREEALARQQAAQGDPNVAGKMLADGSLTIADLKTRGTTPQFIEQATLAAQKQNPTYNPADEVIAEHVAKSSQANQFFGSANSLIAKGGTLDQLEAQGKKIPGNQLPVLNTVEDWIKLASGKGPLAGYAATALGVADDYGKVMGGGNASDHARDAALQLFAKAQSPEQRAEAIKATRNAVQSQRDSRIGNNQFLKRQYGAETGGNQFQVPAGAPAAPKEDGHKLKQGDKVVAISQGGQWTAP